jgi:hypothetical protein
MPKKYLVEWRDAQRELRSARIQTGTAPARTVRRAHTLLRADAPQPVQTIAVLWHLSAVTVPPTCTRFMTAGLEPAL